MKQNINLIVAIGPNNVIGIKDKLLWNSKKDLQRFKELTKGKACIFGATTFYGLPNYPLKDRLNIVLDNTQKEEITADNRGWVTCNSLECALLFCANYKDVFICGGKSIYEYALKYNFINNVYLTTVDFKDLHDFIDTLIQLGNKDLVYFPLDIKDYLRTWEKLETKQEQDENGLNLKFESYRKI